MVVVLPLLLYPVLGIGMAEMALVFREQARTVVVLGSENLPDPQLIDGQHFAKEWFSSGDDPKKLDVVSDADESRGQESTEKEDTSNAKPNDPKVERNRHLLDVAKQVVFKLEQQKEWQDENTENSEEEGASKNLSPEELTARQEQQRELSQLLSDEIEVVIVIPKGFRENIENPTDDDYARPQVIHNKAKQKSVIAYRRVDNVLRNWERQILERRLTTADLPPKWTRPVAAEAVDVSIKSQIAASAWSTIFPAILILMAVTGAFYPAVDIAAGEKERGTMETLLICPARRSEIVLGKFFTVLLFSMTTAILNLVSMGFTGKFMFGMGGGNALRQMGSLDFPSWGALAWVLILLVPIAMLFSALSLALATFARSSKEGQYYLTPLLTVTMGLAMFCLSPAVELTPFLSVLPVIGPTLLLKELLASPGATEPLTFAAPVLATSIIYSLLALWWAIDQFAREDILFREAERFEIKLWIRHLLRDKEDFPTFGEALSCFAFIMFLQFGAISFLGDAIRSALPGEKGTQMMKILMVQQIALIASPALFMGVILTKSVVKTFRLRLPDWKILVAAGALPVILHPIILELASFLGKHFFPALDEKMLEELAAISDPNQPLWLVVAAFALAPAICEEVAFRGFILSGFAKTGRFGIAIVLSSLAFGIMHLIPQQVFNATLLGMLIGLIAIKSRSLYPGILFHFVNNALSVLHQRKGEQVISWVDANSLNLWAAGVDGQLRYNWPTLIACAIVAALIIRWIYRIQLQPVPAVNAEQHSQL